MREPNATRGIALMATSYLLLVFDATAVHALGGQVSLWQMTLCRGVGSALLVGALSRGHLVPAFRTGRPGLQLLRGVLSIVSLWLIFYGLAWLPLADATALSYLRPVFLTLIGAAVLRETVALRRWLATGVSLVGCLIITSPAFAAWHPAYLATVAGAFLNAAAIAATRALAREDAPLTTMAWITGTMLVCSLPGAFDPWPWDAWSLLLCLAVFGTAALWCGLLAVQYADVSLLAPYDYTRLVLAGLLGLVLFGEVPSGPTLIGSALILASCGALFWREGRHVPRQG